MRLYRDYKSEQEQLRKEEADREAMLLHENTVIVYEQGSSLLKKICSLLCLLLLLLLIAVLIIAFIRIVFFVYLEV